MNIPTPGPWEVAPDRLGIIAKGARHGYGIAHAFSHPAICPKDPAEAEANARLIAAAPSLREACNSILAGPVDEPQIELSGEYETGLFCGLEDRGLQDTGYEACRYGFEQGVERGVEWAQGIAESALALARPAPQSPDGEVKP